MNNQTLSNDTTDEFSQTSRTVAIRFVVLTIFMIAVLFLAAGRLDWWEGWSYVVLTMGMLIASRLYILKKDPNLLIERMEATQHENVKAWDKILVPLIASIGPLVVWIVAGLDTRFGWPPSLPVAIQVVSLAIILMGTLFGEWAVHVNRFFSSHVRIQTDRGHSVVSSGPYRIMRHPGYAGALVVYLAIPFFFSSYWVAVPSLVILMALILRTSLEDQTLQEELPGYKDYTNKVRYRLVPGIW
jgi:protein-S-isoprenylcysteine O-methyltransferase Ste14